MTRDEFDKRAELAYRLAAAELQGGIEFLLVAFQEEPPGIRFRLMGNTERDRAILLLTKTLSNETAKEPKP